MILGGENGIYTSCLLYTSICSNCGTEQDNTVAYCSKCGAKLVEEVKAEVVEEVESIQEKAEDTENSMEEDK